MTEPTYPAWLPDEWQIPDALVPPAWRAEINAIGCIPPAEVLDRLYRHIVDTLDQITGAAAIDDAARQLATLKLIRLCARLTVCLTDEAPGGDTRRLPRAKRRQLLEAIELLAKATRLLCEQLDPLRFGGAGGQA